MAIFHNERKPQAVRAARELGACLRRRGVRVGAGKRMGAASLRSCDLALAVGGDGTVLRAARRLAPLSVPLLGVNTGGLGFLTAFAPAALKRGVGLLIGGSLPVSMRAMLEVEARRGRRRVFGPVAALNDCVIRSGDEARPVLLKAECDGRYVGQYFGDGLIVATPTGSTAYALAVGGPIVDPGLDAFVLAPISSHTLTQRPLILPGARPLRLRLGRRGPGVRSHAFMAVDGQTKVALRAEDEVVVRRCERPLKLLGDPRRSYFDVLREKLKWGER